MKLIGKYLMLNLVLKSQGTGCDAWNYVPCEVLAMVKN
jgi:hypothetical protein